MIGIRAILLKKKKKNKKIPALYDKMYTILCYMHVCIVCFNKCKKKNTLTWFKKHTLLQNNIIKIPIVSELNLKDIGI